MAQKCGSVGVVANTIFGPVGFLSLWADEGAGDSEGDPCGKCCLRMPTHRALSFLPRAGTCPRCHSQPMGSIPSCRNPASQIHARTTETPEPRRVMARMFVLTDPSRCPSPPPRPCSEACFCETWCQGMWPLWPVANVPHPGAWEHF